MSSTDDLGVTAIIASYNHGRFVEQALDSVLAQTRRPRQLIVTDDASSDDSAERIDRWLAENWPDATFIRHADNTGLPRTLNEAVARADQDLVVLMAADDWMEPDRLALQVDVLATAPARVGFVYSDMNIVDEDGVATGERYYDHERDPVEGDVLLALLADSFVSAPTVMMRRDVLVDVGPYDEALSWEDWDMNLRMARRVEFAYLPQALVNYRRFGASMSKAPAFQAAHANDSIYIMRKHVGVSDAADGVIAARVLRTARELYGQGRDPRLTASDARLVLRLRPSAGALALLAVGVLRVPGPSLRRARARVRLPVPRIRRTAP